LAEIIFFFLLYIISAIFIAAFPKMSYELAYNSWKKRDDEKKEKEKARLDAKKARRDA
jgi:hypothetical protein